MPIARMAARRDQKRQGSTDWKSAGGGIRQVIPGILCAAQGNFNALGSRSAKLHHRRKRNPLIAESMSLFQIQWGGTGEDFLQIKCSDLASAPTNCPDADGRPALTACAVGDRYHGTREALCGAQVVRH